MSKRIKIVLLTTLIVSLGFLRGYIFYNINWIYKTLVNGRMNQARHEFYFFLNWSPTQINILKWFLTILFSVLFLGLTYLIVKISFDNKSFNRMVVQTFLALFGIAGFFYIIGVLFEQLDVLYGIVRTIMGMVQSFFPLMVLVLIFRFFPSRN